MDKFLSIKDVANLDSLVTSAQNLKKAPFVQNELGRNKTMVLIFLNPSLRTRLSTQKAAQNLGMKTIVMNMGQEGWQLEFEDGVIMDGGKAEHIREAATVISHYADIIGIRTFAGLESRELDYSEYVLQQFVKFATVPVINMESATCHPLQGLTDLMTIREHQSTSKPKVILTWAPHPRALPQAVANSFVRWMRSGKVDLVVTHPEGYDLAPEIIADTKVDYDRSKAFDGADFVYAKNWSSYENYGSILSDAKEWMVDVPIMKHTNNAFFMHCLPVRRNVVVQDGVIDSSRSLVQQQAANREWAAQSVITEILKSM